MDKKDLTKGTRIYFNGDQANMEGLGVITRQITDRWGTRVDIKMDDGQRSFNGLSVTAFSTKYLGHGGTRFVTEKAYRDFRQDQISKVEASLAQTHREDEIDDALVPKYAIQPLRTAVLVKFAEGEIDVKELARAELRDRGVAFVQDPDDELDKMLVEASREAEHRGDSELMDSLRAMKLGFEYQAKLAVEEQLDDRKKGHSDGEFYRGKAKAYEKATEDLDKVIKRGS